MCFSYLGLTLIFIYNIFIKLNLLKNPFLKFQFIMKKISFLFALLSITLFSCMDKENSTKTCGEAANYDIITELNWNNQTFNYKTRLYDSKLRNRDLFDIAKSIVEQEEFAPLQKEVESTLSKKFNELTYLVFYYDIDLSDKNTKINFDNIKAVSTYEYQKASKRYAHVLYKKEGNAFKIDSKFSSFVNSLAYNHINNIIKNEICPNQVDRGYLLVKNLTEAKKHYKERKESMSSSFLMNTSQFRALPHQFICNYPCENQTGDICEEDLITVTCNENDGCLAVDVGIADPTLGTYIPLYYSIRNNVLNGTIKGDQYISDYYYISAITNPLNLLPLANYLSSKIGVINQKLLYISDNTQYGNEIIIDPSFKTILFDICDLLEGMSDDNNYLSLISDFRTDVNSLENKNVSEIISFLNS